ncbi:MAG TPA: hypothetical protein VGN57_19025 [Pirellulaceae bacterium]|jgi:hypothetical protein|nr:hypothetical protein [Pirellulaceae bacterium]
MRIFQYTGPKNSIGVKGETLHHGKPFSTENTLVIAALEARMSNEKDVKELTPDRS